MTALEQLEALNPVPEPRGNPGSHQQTWHGLSRRKAAALFAAAAAVVIVGGLAIGARSNVPVDVDVAAQLEDTPDAVPAQPVPTEVQEPTAAAQIAPSPDLPGGERGADAAIARLTIPSIELDLIVVDDVSVTSLRKGPGHYPESAFPGQAGNAAIAGHRTTYGSAFHNLDQLQAGDSIYVTTLQGVFEYQVSEQRVVEPDELAVLDDVGDNRLTLTTGHPKFSNRQYLIVVASLVGDPAPPVHFEQFAIVDQIAGNSGANDIPDISNENFRDGRQPYFSFIGNTDALASAQAFVESQFDEWAEEIELVVTTQTERAAAVRWTDGTHGTAGWIVVFLSDGVYHVWDMTMDGVTAPIHQSQIGGRGFVSADRSVTLDVLRPVPFSASPDHEQYLDDPLSTEPLVIRQIQSGESGALVTFEIAGDEGNFQEVRILVRNEAGEQIGGIAASLALPALHELAIVSPAGESEAIRSQLEAHPEVIVGPLGWDRWQSVNVLRAFAPEFAPADVNDVPGFEITMFALRPVETPEQFQIQTELLQSLSGLLISVPQPGVDSTVIELDMPAPAAGYVIDELPSVDLCRHLYASGWARPEVVTVLDPEVFATPERARDSAAETATGHTVEFRNTDGVVLGFARPAEWSPWTFSSLAVVEQVPDGWVLSRWERATC